jgi:predicted DCC family thiol-disulfide oxidoreductase YuxK
MSATARRRVLYDEGCGFCRWCIGVLLALDRHRALRPVAIGSAEGRMLLADLDEQARWASWHLVDPDGRRTSGGAAVAPLLDLLPGGRAPAALARALPGPVDGGYRLVVRHRSLVGRPIGRRARARADRRIARRS